MNFLNWLSFQRNQVYEAISPAFPFLWVLLKKACDAALYVLYFMAQVQPFQMTVQSFSFSFTCRWCLMRIWSHSSRSMKSHLRNCVICLSPRWTSWIFSFSRVRMFCCEKKFRAELDEQSVKNCSCRVIVPILLCCRETCLPIDHHRKCRFSVLKLLVIRWNKIRMRRVPRLVEFRNRN